MQETLVQSLIQEDSPGEGVDNLLQCSCLGNPIDRGAWWAIVHEVLKESDTNPPSKNTGVCSHPVIQGIFLNQGSNMGFLHCRQILYHLNHWENPKAANRTTLKKQSEQETTMGPHVFLPLFSGTLEASPGASAKLKTFFFFTIPVYCSRWS